MSDSAAPARSNSIVNTASGGYTTPLMQSHNRNSSLNEPVDARNSLSKNFTNGSQKMSTRTPINEIIFEKTATNQDYEKILDPVFIFLFLKII